MKNLIFFLSLSLLSLGACKQDQPGKIDVNALQKSIDSDQEVAKLRNLLYSHTRLLVSVPKPEFDAILAKLHSCGLYGSTASMADLETCLADLPSKDIYLESQKQFREYSEQFKIVEKRFPEFAQLDHKKQAEMLVPVNEQAAQEVLSDYLSKRKN